MAPTICKVDNGTATCFEDTSGDGVQGLGESSVDPKNVPQSADLIVNDGANQKTGPDAHNFLKSLGAAPKREPLPDAQTPQPEPPQPVQNGTRSGAGELPAAPHPQSEGGRDHQETPAQPQRTGTPTPDAHNPRPAAESNPNGTSDPAAQAAPAPKPPVAGSEEDYAAKSKVDGTPAKAIDDLHLSPAQSQALYAQTIGAGGDNAAQLAAVDKFKNLPAADKELALPLLDDKGLNKNFGAAVDTLKGDPAAKGDLAKAKGEVDGAKASLETLKSAKPATEAEKTANAEAIKKREGELAAAEAKVKTAQERVDAAPKKADALRAALKNSDGGPDAKAAMYEAMGKPVPADIKKAMEADSKEHGFAATLKNAGEAVGAPFAAVSAAVGPGLKLANDGFGLADKIYAAGHRNEAAKLGLAKDITTNIAQMGKDAAARSDARRKGAAEFADKHEIKRKDDGQHTARAVAAEGASTFAKDMTGKKGAAGPNGQPAQSRYEEEAKKEEAQARRLRAQNTIARMSRNPGGMPV